MPIPMFRDRSYPWWVLIRRLTRALCDIKGARSQIHARKRDTFFREPILELYAKMSAGRGKADGKPI